MNGIINFKGIKNGVILKVSSGSTFEDIKIALELKAEKNTALLIGANIVGVEGKKFSYKEKVVLEEILIKLFKINVLNLELFTYNNDVDSGKLGKTLFISKTLRSGAEVISDGDLIIFGDVNPGAVIKAQGNIVVMGRLRGTAHAGMNGELDACIAANELMPSQIRICDFISRSPDNMEIEHELEPEKAIIIDNRIVIESI